MGSECCKCHSDKNVQTRNASLISSNSSYYTRRCRNNQHPLPNDRYRPYNTHNRSSLAIRQLTFDDIGNYSAESEDSYGTSSRLASIDLSVEKRLPRVPVFWKRLHDVTVKIGSRARFLVEIDSTLPLKVTWYHDNQILRKNDRFNFLEESRYYCLEVAWLLLQDEGHWTCIAENKYGCSVSSAYLTILVPKAYKAPHFVEELKAILAQNGTISLECKVTGVPTPSLQWYKDGKKIKAGDTYALKVNVDDNSSLGTYSCVAKNCLGQAFSSSTVHFSPEKRNSNDGSIFPLGPQPKFLRELRNVEVQIESPLTLSCQVVVPPWPKTIDWYNKTGKITDSTKYKMVADGLGMYGLEIKSVEMMDDGEWKCVATSFFGIKAFTSGYVTVKFPKNYKTPKFLENLRAAMTPEGLVSFECKVIGYPTPQLKWLKDGKELKPGDVYQLTGTNSLGTYCCIAKNSMGEIKSTTVLTLEDIQSQLTEEERLMIYATNQPPYFIKSLATQDVKINDEFQFHVQVSAKPEPTILWYRDDEQIEENERISTHRESEGHFWLKIKNLQLKDQTEWKCVAVNDYGQSVTSCFMKLIIPKHYKPPKFLEELKASFNEEGVVNLECKIIGVPQPELKWFKDGRLLKPGDMHKIITGTDGTCSLGTYSCEAVNCMAAVRSSATLLAYTSEKKMQNKEQNLGLKSLSVIMEERSSQLKDSTMISDKSTTYDDAVEVSFSFDGKEVSISLYETPDLTEEEALQIVEMYANELTEQISEHSKVELPSLRFVKETITTGNILMEAMVVDVPMNENMAEDELKTDADVENSMMDDSAFVTNNSPHSEDTTDKNNSEFTYNILQTSQSYIDDSSIEKSRNIHQNQTSANQSETAEESKAESANEHKNITEISSEILKSKHVTSPHATLQKRKSFDSEDDSLHEFEKLKAAKVKRRSNELLTATVQNEKSSGRDDIRNWNDETLPEFPGLSSSEHHHEGKQPTALETIAVSINRIEEELDRIQEEIISYAESDSAYYALSVLQSLLTSLGDIKNSLQVVQEELSDENGDLSQTTNESILTALSKPVQEFEESMTNIEYSPRRENDEVFNKTRKSILNAVIQPLKQINDNLQLIENDVMKRKLTEIHSDPGSVDSDYQKMIAMLNEYDKELENLVLLTQRSSENTQTETNIYDHLKETVDQMVFIKDWSLDLHKNALQEMDYEANTQDALTEFNYALVQFLDTNINVIKSMLTSSNAENLEKFVRETYPSRENLRTTIKVTEHLSALTTVDYVREALKYCICASEIFANENQANLLVANPDCLKCIDDSIETILNSLDTTEKCSRVETSYHKKKLLLSLDKLRTPMQHLHDRLRSIEKQFSQDETVSGVEIYELVNVISDPLQTLRKEIAIMVNEYQCQEPCVSVNNVLLLVIPALKNLQDSVTTFHEIVFDRAAQEIDIMYILAALNNLNPPLNEFADRLIEVEGIILAQSPVVSDPRLGIRIVMQSVSNLIDALSDLQSDSFSNHSTSVILSKFNSPFVEVKNCLQSINDRFYEEDLQKINITMLKTLSNPFNSLQKELIEAAEVVTGELKYALTDLQRTILTIQDQVSFEYGDEPASIEYNIMTLQTLIQPINVLQQYCIDIKNNLSLENSIFHFSTNIVDKLESDQIEIVEQIEKVLTVMTRNHKYFQTQTTLANSIHSTSRMMKNYKTLLLIIKNAFYEKQMRSDSIDEDVKILLQQLSSDFQEIEKSADSLSDLIFELRNIIKCLKNVETNLHEGDWLLLAAESLNFLTPIFERILTILNRLSESDFEENESVKCFIALLQSLNTIRTLQENVKNFQSSSNTDSIQVPMLLSFLNTCERLEIKISDLLFIVENFADRKIILNPQFYECAIKAFSTVNQQLVHLNKCLIDQSMSDDEQKEIPFESSINLFSALLATIDVETENPSLKQIQLIIKDGIVNELIRLKNDILFNMSLIQTEDEISLNESDQLEENLNVVSPDLFTVCTKSINDEVQRCGKYFDKIDKAPLEQKLKYVNQVGASMESVFNIVNFVSRNMSTENNPNHSTVAKLHEPVVKMLQQVRQIKAAWENCNSDALFGLSADLSSETKLLPLLSELKASFDELRSTTSVSGTSEKRRFREGTLGSTSECDSEDLRNDLSSSTDTDDFVTVRQDPVESSHQDKRSCSPNFTESSSLSSDVFVENRERESSCDVTVKHEVKEKLGSENESCEKNKIENVETVKCETELLSSAKDTTAEELELANMCDSITKAFSRSARVKKSQMSFINNQNEISSFEPEENNVPKIAEENIYKISHDSEHSRNEQAIENISITADADVVKVSPTTEHQEVEDGENIEYEDGIRTEVALKSEVKSVNDSQKSSRCDDQKEPNSAIENQSSLQETKEGHKKYEINKTTDSHLEIHEKDLSKTELKMDVIQETEKLIAMIAEDEEKTGNDDTWLQTSHSQNIGIDGNEESGTSPQEVELAEVSIPEFSFVKTSETDTVMQLDMYTENYHHAESTKEPEKLEATGLKEVSKTSEENKDRSEIQNFENTSLVSNQLESQENITEEKSITELLPTRQEVQDQIYLAENITNFDSSTETEVATITTEENMKAAVQENVPVLEESLIENSNQEIEKLPTKEALENISTPEELVTELSEVDEEKSSRKQSLTRAVVCQFPSEEMTIQDTSGTDEIKQTLYARDKACLVENVEKMDSTTVTEVTVDTIETHTKSAGQGQKLSNESLHQEIQDESKSLEENTPIITDLFDSSKLCSHAELSSESAHEQVSQCFDTTENISEKKTMVNVNSIQILDLVPEKPSEISLTDSGTAAKSGLSHEELILIETNAAESTQIQPDDIRSKVQDASELNKIEDIKIQESENEMKRECDSSIKVNLCLLEHQQQIVNDEYKESSFDELKLNESQIVDTTEIVETLNSDIIAKEGLKLSSIHQQSELNDFSAAEKNSATATDNFCRKIDQKSSPDNFSEQHLDEVSHKEQIEMSNKCELTKKNVENDNFEKICKNEASIFELQEKPSDNLIDTDSGGENSTTKFLKKESTHGNGSEIQEVSNLRNINDGNKKAESISEISAKRSVILAGNISEENSYHTDITENLEHAFGESIISDISHDKDECKQRPDEIETKHTSSSSQNLLEMPDNIWVTETVLSASLQENQLKENEEVTHSTESNIIDHPAEFPIDERNKVNDLVPSEKKLEKFRTQNESIDSVTDVYWDSKECVPGCTLQHDHFWNKLSQSVSEQESFDTALEDLETSVTGEDMSEFENISFDIENVEDKPSLEWKDEISFNSLSSVALPVTELKKPQQPTQAQISTNETSAEMSEYNIDTKKAVMHKTVNESHETCETDESANATETAIRTEMPNYAEPGIFQPEVTAMAAVSGNELISVEDFKIDREIVSVDALLENDTNVAEVSEGTILRMGVMNNTGDEEEFEKTAFIRSENIELRQITDQDYSHQEQTDEKVIEAMNDVIQHDKCFQDTSEAINQKEVSRLETYPQMPDHKNELNNATLISELEPLFTQEVDGQTTINEVLQQTSEVSNDKPDPEAQNPSFTNDIVDERQTTFEIIPACANSDVAEVNSSEALQNESEKVNESEMRNDNSLMFQERKLVENEIIIRENNKECDTQQQYQSAVQETVSKETDQLEELAEKQSKDINQNKEDNVENEKESNKDEPTQEVTRTSDDSKIDDTSLLNLCQNDSTEHTECHQIVQEILTNEETLNTVDATYDTLRKMENSQTKTGEVTCENLTEFSDCKIETPAVHSNEDIEDLGLALESEDHVAAESTEITDVTSLENDEGKENVDIAKNKHTAEEVVIHEEPANILKIMQVSHTLLTAETTEQEDNLTDANHTSLDVQPGTLYETLTITNESPTEDETKQENTELADSRRKSVHWLESSSTTQDDLPKLLIPNTEFSNNETTFITETTENISMLPEPLKESIQPYPELETADVHAAEIYVDLVQKIEDAMTEKTNENNLENRQNSPLTQEMGNKEPEKVHHLHLEAADEIREQGKADLLPENNSVPHRQEKENETSTSIESEKKLSHNSSKIQALENSELYSKIEDEASLSTAGKMELSLETKASQNESSEDTTQLNENFTEKSRNISMSIREENEPGNLLPENLGDDTQMKSAKTDVEGLDESSLTMVSEKKYHQPEQPQAGDDEITILSYTKNTLQNFSPEEPMKKQIENIKIPILKATLEENAINLDMKEEEKPRTDVIEQSTENTKQVSGTQTFKTLEKKMECTKVAQIYELENTEQFCCDPLKLEIFDDNLAQATIQEEQHTFITNKDNNLQIHEPPKTRLHENNADVEEIIIKYEEVQEFSTQNGESESVKPTRIDDTDDIQTFNTAVKCCNPLQVKTSTPCPSTVEVHLGESQTEKLKLDSSDSLIKEEEVKENLFQNENKGTDISTKDTVTSLSASKPLETNPEDPIKLTKQTDIVDNEESDRKTSTATVKIAQRENEEIPYETVQPYADTHPKPVSAKSLLHEDDFNKHEKYDIINERTETFTAQKHNIPTTDLSPCQDNKAYEEIKEIPQTKLENTEKNTAEEIETQNERNTESPLEKSEENHENVQKITEAVTHTITVQNEEKDSDFKEMEENKSDTKTNSSLTKKSKSPKKESGADKCSNENDKFEMKTSPKSKRLSSEKSNSTEAKEKERNPKSPSPMKESKKKSIKNRNSTKDNKKQSMNSSEDNSMGKNPTETLRIPTESECSATELTTTSWTKNTPHSEEVNISRQNRLLSAGDVTYSSVTVIKPSKHLPTSGIIEEYEKKEIEDRTDIKVDEVKRKADECESQKYDKNIGKKISKTKTENETILTNESNSVPQKDYATEKNTKKDRNTKFRHIEQPVMNKKHPEVPEYTIPKHANTDDTKKTNWQTKDVYTFTSDGKNKKTGVQEDLTNRNNSNNFLLPQINWTDNRNTNALYSHPIPHYHSSLTHDQDFMIKVKPRQLSPRPLREYERFREKAKNNYANSWIQNDYMNQNYYTPEKNAASRNHTTTTVRQSRRETFDHLTRVRDLHKININYLQGEYAIRSERFVRASSAPREYPSSFKWVQYHDFKNRIAHINSTTRDAEDILWNGSYSRRFHFIDYLSHLYAEDRGPVGATVRMHVKVEGTPKPSIGWTKHWQTLLPIPSRYSYIQDVHLHALVITDIFYHEAGMYQCKAWNKYGFANASTDMNMVTLVGYQKGKPPMFLSRPNTIISVNSGSDVSVSFRLSGDPKPKVQWMKGLTDITETVRTLKETVNDYTRLTLKRAHLSDAGTYFITAKNTHGSDRAFFTLRVNQRSRSLTPVPFYRYEAKNYFSNDYDTRKSLSNINSKFNSALNYSNSMARERRTSIKLRLIHSRSHFLYSNKA